MCFISTYELYITMGFIMTFSYTRIIHSIIFTPMTLLLPSYSTDPLSLSSLSLFSVQVLLLMLLLLLMMMLLMMMLFCCCLWWPRVFIMVACWSVGEGYIQEHSVLPPSSTTNFPRSSGRHWASWALPLSRAGCGRPILETLCRLTKCDDYVVARKQCFTTSPLLELLSPPVL